MTCFSKWVCLEIVSIEIFFSKLWLKKKRNKQCELQEVLIELELVSVDTNMKVGLVLATSASIQLLDSFGFVLWILQFLFVCLCASKSFTILTAKGAIRMYLLIIPNQTTIDYLQVSVRVFCIVLDLWVSNIKTIEKYSKTVELGSSAKRF